MAEIWTMPVNEYKRYEANPAAGHGTEAAPPNKPLQRTQSPQGNRSNINEPLVRRPRR